LDRQETQDLFDYSIVIVDNDRTKSSKKTVECFAKNSNLSIRYFVQPEQNIALTRNKAIKKSKGEFVSKNISIPAISSSGAFDLYAVIDENKDNVKFSLWINSGGEYLSSSSSNVSAFTNTQKFLDDFSFKVFKDKVKAELKKEKEKLKDIKSKVEKLEGDHSDYLKDIKKAEKKIEKANKAIAKNLVKQEKAQQSLAKQQQVVDEIQARLNALSKK
jgi:predicted S18 family serine protease